jgi:hypothetical protein
VAFGGIAFAATYQIAVPHRTHDPALPASLPTSSIPAAAINKLGWIMSCSVEINKRFQGGLTSLVE